MRFCQFSTSSGCASGGGRRGYCRNCATTFVGALAATAAQRGDLEDAALRDELEAAFAQGELANQGTR